MKIDKHIDMPEEKKRLNLPYDKMEVGDSFLVTNLGLQRICNANYIYGRKSGKKFTARKLAEGIRVWRVH